MPARFTVLASGSSGNSSLLEAGGHGLLVDCGLGPRVLADRLLAAGRSWKAVSAVVLTHTHGDHWNPLTLAHLRTLNVPLYAHARHHDHLSRCAEHDPLRKAGLARTFAAGEPFAPFPGLTALPVPVPHDSDPTFAFRFEAAARAAGDGPGWALGFASDLGEAAAELLAALVGVDALAVEYNHDVALQRASRRPLMLVNRVLGDRGHLSNAQAADLTRSVAAAAGPGGLSAVVQLHLSRECNRPGLAADAGRAALARHAPAAALVTAEPFAASPSVLLADRPPQTLPAAEPLPFPRRSVQLTLPGFGSARTA